MAKILLKYLTYEEVKENFTKQERAVIRKDFLGQCNDKIDSFKKPFIKAIDKINDI